MKCAIVLFFLIPGSLMATEVDNFTHRYDYLEDSYEIIQDEINLRMYKAVEDANRKSSKICDPKQLYKQLKKQFVAFGWSPMEIAIGKSSTINQFSQPEISVYEYFGGWGNSFSITAKQAPLLRVRDIWLGADKFSHFFNEGWNYYKKAYLQNKGLAAALDYGHGMEKGFWGELFGGIYSYGDLVANYNGMFFWKKILDDENPYVDCPDDRWEMIEKFELSDYLDAAYDEGINCSSFRTKALQNAFDRRIRELEEETGMNMSCPIRKSDCSELRKKYGELSDHLLHPKCI